MTMTSTTMRATPAPRSDEAADEREANRKLVRNVLIGIALVAVLFVGAYGIAWARASRLTATFMADADASYNAGNYVESLTGYEEYSQEAGKYVAYGGYMKALNIWSSGMAWPQPAGLDRAQARIDEVLRDHLTAEQAEGFIQTNIGTRNPFMGTIFLRLGELYEQEGDAESAREVYQEVPELFPGREDLIAQASERLAALGE